MRPRDTSAEAQAIQTELLRRVDGGRRVEMAFEMSELAREIAIDGVLADAPGMSRDQARRVVLRRIMGDDLFVRAFGAV